MTAATLLKDLTARGASLEVEADNLRIHAPKGVLTDQVKILLAELKPELLRLLSRPRPGSLQRPQVYRARVMPADCGWDDCEGELARARGDLYQCDTCGCYFERRDPETPGDPLEELASRLVH